MLIRKIKNKISHLLFNPHNKEQKKLQKFALLKYDNIFTHMTTTEKLALFGIIKKFNKPIIAAEIGSYLGASACFICKALKPNSKLICIDTWENDAMQYGNDIDGEKRDTYQEFINNTLDFSSSIIEMRGWSNQVSDKVQNIYKNLNFLFIDGDHNYEGVKQDWALYKPMLKKGSIVAFHDTGWAEGVKKVITEEVLLVADLVLKLPNLEFYRIK